MAKFALISVADKTGIVDLASKLVMLGYEIISTGGTAGVLNAAEITTIDMSAFTGIPEMLDGRVKTLNNWIYAGILAKRDCSQDEEIDELELKLIDIVVVNLYPFESTIASGAASHDEVLENIDIGGVSLLRASAKNYH